MKVPDYDPLSAAPHPEEGLQRGRQGRPKLIPRGLSTRIEYTRASALSAYIMGGNRQGLERWQKRLIIRGAGIRPDLARMAAAESYEQAPGTEKDVLYREAGQNLDRYWEEAIIAAGGQEKANWGTAVHSRVMKGSHGQVPTHPTPEDEMMERSVEGFHAALRGTETVASELFCANDELLTAGTFDAAMDIPGITSVHEMLCADWKTGELHVIEHVVQLAGYCRSDLYDVSNDQRTSFAERFGKKMRTDVGLVVRIPPALANHPDPAKRVVLLLVDLDEGWRLAKVAAYVRQMQKTQSLAEIRKLDPREIVQQRAQRDMLALGPNLSREGLSAIHARYRSDWSAELTEFGTGLLERVAPGHDR